MRSCTALGIIVTTALANIAIAGTPDRITPPPVDASTSAGRTSVALDDIVERRAREIERPPVPTGDQRIVDDARRGIRRITIELALLGREHGDAAVLAAFHALRLDATMRSIDRILESLARSGTMLGTPPVAVPEVDRVDALERLDAFNRRGLDLLRRSDTRTIAGLDATLATALAPLRDVFGRVSGRPLESRWPPPTAGWTGRPPAAIQTDPPPSTDRIVELLSELRNASSAPEFDVDVLERMLLDSEPSQRSTGSGSHRRLVEILTLLRDGMDASEPVANPTLRGARRDALARRRDALRTLRASPAMGSDPAKPDLEDEDLEPLRRSTEILAAIRRLDDLATGIATLHPPATRRAERMVAAHARSLGSRREWKGTLERIRRITDDLQRFSTIDFEARLRDPDASVIRLVGGRTRELSDRFTAARIAWVDAVTSGDASDPRLESMDRIARLGSLLEDLLPLVDAEDGVMLDLEIADRWGGWYVDDRILGWSTRTLLPGVRLAVGSAIEGDALRFERELAGLESRSPLVRLAAEIQRRTRDSTGTLPGGGIATIASITMPPTASAWGVDRRVALAAACVGMMELAAAGSRVDPEVRREAEVAARAACEVLLDDLKTDDPVGREIRP